MADPSEVPPFRPSSIGRRALASLRDHAVKVVASLVIAGGFVWMFAKGGLPLLPPWSAFEQMTWWAVPLAVAFNIAASFFRTYRWVYLLRPLSPGIHRWRVLGLGLLGATAVLFAPFRMGEVARPYLIAQDREVTFAQATGTVGAERVIDGLFVTVSLLVALLASTPLSPLPTKVGELSLPVAKVYPAVYAMLGVFTAAFVAMGLFYWARDFARRMTLAVVGVASRRLAEFLADKVQHVADGLAFLPSGSVTRPFLRDTIVYWLVVALGQWAALRGTGVPATFVEAWVTVGVVGLGSLIPAGPGFFGAYQLAAFCGLAMYFDEAIVLGPGVAFVFVIYTTQIGVSILSGLAGLLLVRRFPARGPAVTMSPATP